MISCWLRATIKGDGKRWTGREEGAGGQPSATSGGHTLQVAVRHLNSEECVYAQSHTAYNGYHSFSASGA